MLFLLGFLVVFLVVLVVLFNVVLLLIPIMIIVAVGSYFWRKIAKQRNVPKNNSNVISAEYKVKKEE